MPQLYSITGCDTTSYFYKVGNVSELRRLLKDPSQISLITDLWKDKEMHVDTINKCITFIQTVMYGGHDDEKYVETRIRLYK